MNVDGASEERQHAERESHNEAEKEKIGPGHNSPRQPLPVGPCREPLVQPTEPFSSATKPSVRTLFAVLLGTLGMQHLVQALRQSWRPQDLPEQQKRPPRILYLGDGQQRLAQCRIAG